MGIKQEEWERSFQKALDYYNKHGNIDVSSSFVTENGFKLGTWIQNQKSSFKKGKLSIDRLNKLKSIELDFSSKRYRIDWEEAYKIAKEYYEENGNLDVPSRYSQDGGFALGEWIHTQRGAFKKNKLSEERVNKLNKIGMRFDSKIHDWYGAYEIVKKYYEENGNLDVGDRSKSVYGYRLGWWLACQRTEYRKGNLSKDKIELLEMIGLDFDSIIMPQTWEESYENAVMFYKTYHHLRIPRDYQTEDGYNLGKWINTQKYNYYRNKLTDDQINKLKVIGFDFKKANRITWEESYKYAKEYYEIHGDLKIPRDYQTEDGYNLGLWIHSQSQDYRDNKLDQNKIKLLENIEMDFGKKQLNWNQKYKLAEEYFFRHGNLLVPVSYKTADGFGLGAWISKQRDLYTKKELSEEQINKLLLIGMNFEKKRKNVDDWNYNYKLAMDCFLNTDDIEITSSKKAILSWLKKQLVLYKKGELSQEQINKLLGLSYFNDLLIKKDERSNASNNKNEINFHVAKLCNKLHIDIELNKEVLCKINYNDFRKRLIILQSQKVSWCDPEGKLHYIFSLSNEMLDSNNHIPLTYYPDDDNKLKRTKK